MSFLIRPIQQDHLDRIRRRGLDDFGNELRPRACDEAGAPLRCCLREARAGERIVLIAHRPFAKPGPYSEIGPIFIHAERCDGFVASGTYPEAFRHRRQVLRAYDAHGAILDAVMTEGARAEEAIGALLGDTAAIFLHSRNVLFGCYMFAVERGAAAG